MSDFLSPQQGITEQVNLLEKRLQDLAAQMAARPDRLRVDAAYQIPFRNRPTVDEKKEISVIPLASSEAIKQVVHCLTSIHIDEGHQDPRETLRVPGVVALPDDWIDELTKLNSVRKTIENQVGKILDQRERTAVWRRWKYLSSLQTMRQTRIVDGPKKVKFYWDAAPSIVVKTAAEWISEFEKNLKQYHDGRVPALEELSDGDKSVRLVVGIQVLQEMGDVKVVQFRMGQPHIRARVSFHDTQPPLTRPVSAPIVYHIDDKVPYINPLSKWEPDKHTAGKSERVKISETPIMDGHNLYLYK
jgi:hypothetical protein